MEFFEPPPRREPSRQPLTRAPSRFGPPNGILPGVVPVETLVARSDDVAVALGRISAYPEGFGLEVRTIARVQLELDPFDFHYRFRRGRYDEEGIPPHLLRLGVQYADGRKATNIGDNPWSAETKSELTFSAVGGGGGGGEWSQYCWICPLPPRGPLTFVCEWPDMGIELTRHELDADVVVEAAGRAQVIFDLPEIRADDEGEGVYLS